ncbi:hypothetical protein K2P47_01215 [Patescibacteria group bacterium]|nr:hypothetical protein [Patescibacteria group bacterium]
MPLILIVAGLIAILGVGGFLVISRPNDSTAEPVTPITRTEESSPAVEQTPPTSVVSEPEITTPTPTEPTPISAPADSSMEYQNGTYSEVTTYIAPSRSVHTVTTSVTLTNDVITATTVTFSGDTHPTSTNWQSKFTAALQTEIIGKKLTDVSASRIGGASLTTNAYNEALTQIKSSAQS